MKHLVIGQRLKTHNFSAFHWSPRRSLVSVGQHFVVIWVVHLPNRAKANLITDYCMYAIRTRLCGPCIAVLAGSSSLSHFLHYLY